LNALATELRTQFRIEAGSAIFAYFDGAILVEGEAPFAFSPHPRDLGGIVQIVETYDTVDYYWTDLDTSHFIFEASIKPKFPDSKLLVICSLGGIDNGGSGRVVMHFKKDTLSGGTGGTIIFTQHIAQDSTGTSGIQSTSFMRVANVSGAAELYFKIVATKADTTTTWHIGQYSLSKSIIIIEYKD
jgi:hypothetical protein